MILRRVLSQQHTAIASIHEAYSHPSHKRAFLEHRVIYKPMLFGTPFAPGQPRLFGLAETLGEDG
jgi:hypothetical protein